LKFITDLERIGDLLMGVAQRVHARGAPPPEEEARQLLEMLGIVRTMLDQVHQGFTTRDLECARRVLRSDAKIDAICHAMFQDVARIQCADGSPKFEVLLMAQAIERAGDHTKNLAEELYSLIEGHTLRHPPKRKPI
jgi:phosphate transport system protein